MRKWLRQQLCHRPRRIERVRRPVHRGPEWLATACREAMGQAISAQYQGARVIAIAALPVVAVQTVGGRA